MSNFAQKHKNLQRCAASLADQQSIHVSSFLTAALRALGKPTALLKAGFPAGAALRPDVPHSATAAKKPGSTPCSLTHPCSPALSYSNSLVDPHSWSLLGLLNLQKLVSSDYFSVSC